jgi:hypothetical protein
MLVNQYEYPSANVDPRKKGYAWILSYIRAANADGLSYMPGLMGNLSYRRLEEIRSYALGKQSVNKYKKRQPVDALADNTAVNNDYSVVPIICRFREIIISRLMQREYDLQAFAIDPLSKSKEDEIFNAMKIKILMRQAAQQAGSSLANSPVLAKGVGEADDLDELAMQAEFGYKDVMCEEAEQAIELVKQQNQFEEKRKRCIENWVDYGLGGYMQDIDENGKCINDDVPVKNLLVSFCEKNDFSDMVHRGVYVEMNLVDLAPYFTPDQMDEIQKSVAGKNNNPRMVAPFRRAWAKHKVTVLKFKLLTYDTNVYETAVDSRGNERFGRTEYSNIQYVQNNGMPLGAQTMAKQATPEDVDGFPRYLSSVKQVVYKANWIVDTDMMFDWGKSENQSRKLSDWGKTSLDMQIYAYNFDNMVFSGVTEKMIPIADSYYLTWQKLQNLKAKLIPYMIELDLTALEAVAMGKGGMNMTPKELIDFAFSNYVLLQRSNPLVSEKNPNYRAMRIEASGQLQAFAMLYQDLAFNIQQLYDLTGLNQITAAATPAPKTLVPGYENANIGTDNAIYLIALADKNTMLRMSDNIMCKIQIAVKLGKVEGYVKPLGWGNVKFLSINPDLSLWDMGIFLDDAPTQEERMMLYQEMTAKETEGIIMPADKLKVMGMRNLKQAQRYLAYVTKKGQERKQQEALQLTNANTQGQTQMLMMGEKAKQETIKVQGQIDMQKLMYQMQMQYEIEKMKKGSDMEEGINQGQAKIISAKIMADAKVHSTHLQNGANLIQTHMDNEADIEAAKHKKATA